MLAGVMVLFITLLVVSDIFSREVLNQGLAWAQKYAVYLMIWVGFLGSALATSTGGHLRPEIGDKVWPEKLHPFYHRLRHFITSVFCFGGTYFGIKYVQESLELGDMNPVINQPLWIFQIIIPVSFALIAIKSLLFALVPSTMPPVKMEAH